MSAVPSLPPPAPLERPGLERRAAALAQLRQDLVRKFPGAVAPTQSRPLVDRAAQHNRLEELRRSPFLWIEVAVGQGGLSWLAAWTLLRLADDPLHRPALWIDTHNTLTPGDLLDLEGRLVVVRPADAHEAHVAADIALRAGSFSLVALEMHRALHPTPLARLARLASARHAGSGVHRAPVTHATEGESHTPLIVWGEPPPFLAPPSGIARVPFADAASALLCDPRVTDKVPSDDHEPEAPLADDPSGETARWPRAPHSTDRLRPLDRAADRRPSPPPPRSTGGDMVDSPARSVDDARADRDPRDDDAPFPFTRSRPGDGRG